MTDFQGNKIEGSPKKSKTKRTRGGLSIEKPSLKDMDAIIALWKEQHDYHYGLDPIYYKSWSAVEHEVREHVRRLILQNTPYLLGAKIGEKWVGYITFSQGSEAYFDVSIQDFGEILELIVTKEMRGHRIGEALISEVQEKYFQPAGITYMKILCSATNQGAQRFYKRLGCSARQIIFYKNIRG